MEFRQVIYAPFTALLKHSAGTPCNAEERSLEESPRSMRGFLTLLALDQALISHAVPQCNSEAERPRFSIDIFFSLHI
jgi:hypothetical protein